MKAGLAVVVDQKAAADAAGRILALRKENFIQAARTWNEMLLVAFLQHKKRRSTVDAHNIVPAEENFCESNVTTVSKIHSSEMEKLN